MQTLGVCGGNAEGGPRSRQPRPLGASVRWAPAHQRGRAGQLSGAEGSRGMEAA
jgi:hypothetical protein